MIIQTEEAIKEFCHDIDLATYNYDISPDFKIKLKKSTQLKIFADIGIARKYNYEIPVVFEDLPPKTTLFLQYLNSLENCPNEVNGRFSIDECSLQSLKGIPQFIGGDFALARDNTLSDLDYFPKIIKGYCVLNNTKIKTLKDIHKKCSSIGDEFDISCPIESNILGLLMIKNVYKFTSTMNSKLIFKNALTIIQSHYKSDGSGDVLECQEELIDLGFKDYAKL